MFNLRWFWTDLRIFITSRQIFSYTVCELAQFLQHDLRILGCLVTLPHFIKEEIQETFQSHKTISVRALNYQPSASFFFCIEMNDILCLSITSWMRGNWPEIPIHIHQIFVWGLLVNYFHTYDLMFLSVKTNIFAF